MRAGQTEKVQLAEALSKSDLIHSTFGERFVRISLAPGDTFFHVIIEGHNGRRYLEVSVKERL